MAILRVREMWELAVSVSLSTNNEAEFSYIKKQRFYPLVAEKYNVAFQYHLIKVTWQRWRDGGGFGGGIGNSG